MVEPGETKRCHLLDDLLYTLLRTTQLFRSNFG
jgi:hypothetical protein